MIIYFADGRLGNQLFQYHFLQSQRQHPNELIITSGFEEIKRFFTNVQVININKHNRYLRFMIYELIGPVCLLLSNLRLISETTALETGKIQKKIGLLWFINYIKSGFFQNQDFFDMSKRPTFEIRKKYLGAAKVHLDKIPKRHPKIFVHVRRGDYAEFLVGGKPTLLPSSYYKQAIEMMTEEYGDPYFVFLSDDPQYVSTTFKKVANKWVSTSQSPGIDLAIMTLCQGAILAPSSYSWWGSYLMKNRGMVIAPKYWLGFNLGREYPLGITPSYASLLSVR